MTNKEMFCGQLLLFVLCFCIVNSSFAQLPADTTNVSVVSCGSYNWNGFTYNTSGVYVQTLTNAQGGDSVVALHLTVNPLPVLNHTPSMTIQSGETVNLWASGADVLYWSDANGNILSSSSSLTVSPTTTTLYVLTGQNYSVAMENNLVTNGDFQQGNVGFSSSYYYSSNLWPEGNYYIGPNAHNYHTGFYSWQDHTTGTGNYMIINGAVSPNMNVWTQTVAVTPHTDYAFSTWVCTVGGNPQNTSELARLQFSVNGTQLGNIFTAPNSYGVWSNYYEVWNSGNSTTAVLTILNQNTTGSGNDFGIDDIVFAPLNECSVTESVLLYIPEYPDNVMSPDCVYPPDSSAFEMQELFSCPNVNSMSTPMVADLDGDGLPEIIACAYSNAAPWFSSGFHVVDGQTGALKYTIPTVQYCNHGQQITIADVDHDGKAELFVLGKDKRLYCYNYNGGVRWTSYNTVDLYYLISAADVNNDGYAEIVCGKYVYNAQTGALLLQGDMVATGMGYGAPHGYNPTYHQPYYMYALGDVDGDGTLELCAGNTVYKMEINDISGIGGNQWYILRQADSVASIANYDGQTFLADFDNDGDFDICVIGVAPFSPGYASSYDIDIYVWDGQSSDVIAYYKYQVNNTIRGPSIPYSGDLNGDDFPEIVFSVSNVGMMVYTYDSAFASHMSLQQTYPPFGETAGFTVFDFNQDGRNEIVYRGTEELYIVDGITLAALCNPITAYSGTVAEYPLVADVNADGYAEIIVTRGYGDWGAGASAEGWVSVYGSVVPGAWSSARKVWNQWAYSVVNINEDMTVPKYRYDISTVFPNGKRPFNSFLRQMPFIDSLGNLFNLVPDVVVEPSVSVQLADDSLILNFSYCNAGDISLHAPYPITVFLNTFGGDTVCTTVVNDNLPVDSCAQGEMHLPLDFFCGTQNTDSLVVALNCSGNGIAQDGGLQPECDITNNTAAVAVVIPPRTDTVLIEVQACDNYTWNGVTYDTSGVYTQTFSNVHNCDSMVILTLTVNLSNLTEFSDSVCLSVKYSGYGFSLTEDETSTSGSVIRERTLSNQFGCDSLIRLNLYVRPVVTPEFYAVPDKAMLSENTLIQFVNNTDISGVVPVSCYWFWNFGDGETDTTLDANNEHQYTQWGDYVVTLTLSAGGCMDSISIPVVIEADLVFPNVITPNGDGVNDVFCIKNLNPNRQNHLYIANRWGKSVWQQENYQTYMKDDIIYNADQGFCANDLPDGVYFYVFYYEGAVRTLRFNGTITVIRDRH